MWSEFSWLRIGPNIWLLWTEQWTTVFHKRWGLFYRLRSCHHLKKDCSVELVFCADVIMFFTHKNETINTEISTSSATGCDILSAVGVFSDITLCKTLKHMDKFHSNGEPYFMGLCWKCIFLYYWLVCFWPVPVRTFFELLTN